MAYVNRARTRVELEFEYKRRPNEERQLPDLRDGDTIVSDKAQDVKLFTF